jgi:hypothetical protein
MAAHNTGIGEDIGQGESSLNWPNWGVEVSMHAHGGAVVPVDMDTSNGGADVGFRRGLKVALCGGVDRVVHVDDVADHTGTPSGDILFEDGAFAFKLKDADISLGGLDGADTFSDSLLPFSSLLHDHSSPVLNSLSNLPVSLSTHFRTSFSSPQVLLPISLAFSKHDFSPTTLTSPVPDFLYHPASFSNPSFSTIFSPSGASLQISPSCPPNFISPQLQTCSSTLSSLSSSLSSFPVLFSDYLSPPSVPTSIPPCPVDFVSFSHSFSSFKALPAVSSIPFLRSRLDFFAWDEAICTIFRCLGLYGHILDPSVCLDRQSVSSDLIPAIKPVLSQPSTPSELAAFRLWVENDNIVQLGLPKFGSVRFFEDFSEPRTGLLVRFRKTAEP